MSGFHCAAIDVVRRTAAVARVGKDVVDDQRAADRHPLGPAVEVLLGGGLTVPAVDEQQLQRSAPVASHHRRLAHHRDDRVVEPGGVKGAAEGGQRVEPAADRVDHRRVVPLPARLVLFGAVVMIDRVQHAVGRRGGRTEQDRRLAAVGTDLDGHPAVQVADGRVVQRLSLVRRHETHHLVGQFEQSGSLRAGRGVGTAHGSNLSCRRARWPAVILSHPTGCSSVRTCV